MSVCSLCFKNVSRIYRLGYLCEIYHLLISEENIDGSVSVCSWCYCTLSKMYRLREISRRGHYNNGVKLKLQEDGIYNFEMKVYIDHYDYMISEITDYIQNETDHDNCSDIKDEQILDTVLYDDDYEDGDFMPKLELKLDKQNVLMPKITSTRFKAILLTSEQVETDYKQELEQFRIQQSDICCESCLINFQDKKTYTDHNIKHMPKRNTIQCDICKVYLKNDGKCMQIHNRKHYVKYKCNDCPYSNKNIIEIKRHCTTMHPCFKCKVCDVSCKTKSSLRYHLNSHQPKCICDICGKSFNSKLSLIVHLETHEVKNYKCDQCGRSLKTKASFDQHRRNHERREKKVQEPAFCVECNMMFRSYGIYRNHLKYSLKHAETPRVACPVCRREFVLEKDMVRHRDFNHYGIGDECKICGKLCPRPNGLTRHMKDIHGNKANRKRNHTCEQCGKAFYILESLREHRRTHSEERTQHCDMCDATFKLKAALYQHRRLVHLKIKKKPNKKFEVRDYN